MTAGRSLPSVRQWEHRTEWPLAALAVVFLANYTAIVLDEHLPQPWHNVAKSVDYTIWALFLVDYLVRLALATDRGRYWYTHIADLAIIALPVLRPLRLLRVVMLLRILNRRAVNSLRERMLIYLVGSALVLVYCAALTILEAERHAPGANITTLGEAIWWAIATFCTVGYGDRFPVTTEGRAVATGLMVGGLILVGVLTASFASYLIERVRQIDEELQGATRRDVAVLRQDIARLQEQLESLRSSGANGRPEDAGDPLRPLAREDLL
jgi:voltage-gated potassium channel